MKLLLVLFLVFNSIMLSAQWTAEGNPFITTFDKKIYAGGSQSWDSGVLGNGHIIFANDQGILEYNGESWSKYTLPNKSIARSLCITSERIFVGGQDEVGYYSPDINGILKFTSIRHHIPDNFLPLQDVWQIEESNDYIFFRSVNKIYKYSPYDDSFEVIDPNAPIISIQNLDNKLYFNNLYKGLHQ